MALNTSSVMFVGKQKKMVEKAKELNGQNFMKIKKKILLKEHKKMDITNPTLFR